MSPLRFAQPLPHTSSTPSVPCQKWVFRQSHDASAFCSSVFGSTPTTRLYSSAWVANSRSNVEQDSSPGYHGWSVFTCGSPTSADAAPASRRIAIRVRRMGCLLVGRRPLPLWITRSYLCATVWAVMPGDCLIVFRVDREPQLPAHRRAVGALQGVAELHRHHRLEVADRERDRAV